MTPDEWAHVKRLFSEALGRAAADRAAWLDEACGSNQAVRAEVDRLLAAHGEAGSFIDQPAADLHPTDAVDGGDSLAGRVLHHYRLDSLIGVGGMGEVYRATDLELGRTVAIKLVSEDEPRAQHRLRREAQHASRLNHPHICTIHEVGREGGRSYIVMEFVEGRPLAEVVRPGGLPTAIAVDYAVQIADALAHAHRHGIVHRDLKSANVMVTSAGSVKLLDFGLARRLESAGAEASAASALSRTGAAIAGTLGYMAPEVLRGLPGDARSDLWALGVLLYEMLTGELPFAGQTPFELSAAILHDAPRPVPPTVAPALATIILQCLRKAPAERYHDATELGRVLKEFQPHAGGRKGGLLRRTRRGAFVVAAVPRRVAALIVRRPAAALAGLVVIAALAVVWYSTRASPPLAPPVRALAVLPFENLSGDPSQDYFADGITEALIVELGRTASLRVISRTTTMRFRGTTKTLPEIARDLGVDALVEGAVVRDGNRVRVTAKLFQADDRQLWTEAFERTMREILVLERDIVRAITTRVRSALTLQDDARLSLVRSIDPDVYETYLKGRYYWNKRSNDSLVQAQQQFELAIQQDPSFAPAYVGLADCYNQFATFMVGSASPAEMRPRVRAAIASALRIDDTLGEAHAALAYVHHYEWEWAEAALEFDRAIRLNPNYALAYIWRANYSMSLRRFDEALQSVRQALELDPMSMVVNTNVGWTLLAAGRPREAVDAFRAALALDPDYIQAHWRLGNAYMQLGRPADAVAEADTVVRLSGATPASLIYAGEIYADAGRRREAEDLFQRVMAMRQRQYVTPFGLAELCFKLGRLDDGFAWLERAYQERSNGLAYMAAGLGRASSDPRYHDFLRRVGLDKAAGAAPPGAAPGR